VAKKGDFIRSRNSEALIIRSISGASFISI
jgi:hypothetical protein